MNMHSPQYGDAVPVNKLTDLHLTNIIGVLKRHIAKGKQAERDLGKYILEKADRVIAHSERILNETVEHAVAAPRKGFKLCGTAKDISNVHEHRIGEVPRCIGLLNTYRCEACPHYIRSKQRNQYVG